MRKQVILIPCLNPEETLIDLVNALFDQGFDRMIVIDDGSTNEIAAPVFTWISQLNFIVEHHEKNLGKGAAIKTGILSGIRNYGNDVSFITVDADGQHLPKDVAKIADAMERCPGELILGTRDFRGDHVPLRSRLGNRITAAAFHLVHGVACPDTQTGLRGIPSNLVELALEETGNRYEYEMNFLSDAVEQTGLQYVEIETVYEDGNRCSHFRPLQDSLLIYGRPLRFLASSMCGALTDLLLFYLIVSLVTFSHVEAVLMATIFARIVSGIVNFQLNRHVSFESKEPVAAEAVRYGMLFVVQMLLSGSLVVILSVILPTMVSKILVDVGLFFVSYIVQKKWVFQKGGANEEPMAEKTSLLMDHRI